MISELAMSRQNYNLDKISDEHIIENAKRKITEWKL